MENKLIIDSKQKASSKKYVSSRNVKILDVSLFENQLCYLFVIHEITEKSFPKVKSIRRRNKICYLNDEKIGKFIGIGESQGQKCHLYTNHTPNNTTSPKQIIYVPKERMNFNIYINHIKMNISSKIIYKHIS